MSSTERPTLSAAETADLLGISRWLVQQATLDGSLPSVPVGRRTLIPRCRLLPWLDGRQVFRAPGPGRDATHTSAPALTVLAPRTPHAS